MFLGVNVRTLKCVSAQPYLSKAFIPLQSARAMAKNHTCQKFKQFGKYSVLKDMICCSITAVNTYWYTSRRIRSNRRHGLCPMNTHTTTNTFLDDSKINICWVTVVILLLTRYVWQDLECAIFFLNRENSLLLFWLQDRTRKSSNKKGKIVRSTHQTSIEMWDMFDVMSFQVIVLCKSNKNGLNSEQVISFPDQHQTRNRCH